MFRQAILQLFLISLIYISTISSAPTKQSLERSSKTYPPYTCYECFGKACDNPYNVTCDVGLVCFTHTEIVDGIYLYREKGCHVLPFMVLARCKSGIAKKRRKKTNPSHTCCNGNFCNDDKFRIPYLPQPTILHPSSTERPKIKYEQLNGSNFEEIILTKGVDLISVAIKMFLATGGTFLIMSLTWFASVTRRSSYHSIKKKTDVLPKLHHKPTVNDTFDSGFASGSGSGLPTLNQRCLAQDVILVKRIGLGRYGEVWHGTKHGENVAVKIFSSVDEASWENEVNMYTSISLYHENILGFKGSCVASRSGVTELWLLTAFHEQGSLYDYLLENTVSHEQMIVFLQSACSGLLHLHMEIFCSNSKPSIAHRDLKTRNILVTPHGTCVIADFGLAIVKSGNSSDTNSYTENYKVGTKRYMAPELLDDSIKTNSFESFKKADMYAFALMMWEVCSRCITDGTNENFLLAFHDCVPENPEFEDMQKVVCTELKRPEIPKSWSSDKPLNSMAELMKHCWHQNPEVRFPALRVKKTLDKIYAQIQERQPSVQTVRL